MAGQGNIAPREVARQRFRHSPDCQPDEIADSFIRHTHRRQTPTMGEAYCFPMRRFILRFLVRRWSALGRGSVRLAFGGNLAVAGFRRRALARLVKRLLDALPEPSG